jgi:hypothetical protein
VTETAAVVVRGIGPVDGGQAAGRARPFGLFAWAAVAAFGSYFCMYGLRMPFKVATYSTVAPVFGGVGFKTLLLVSQVIGYTISKFVGIGLIAGIKPHRRAAALIGLAVMAELSLVGFGFVPTPWNAAMLFLNGLPLGIVFGLVMGFLEGRRQSEAMIAGLCASFIAADGITKSTGGWVMSLGVNPFWMPAVTGLIFLPPLFGFVWMLTRIPAPDPRDIEARSHRRPIDRAGRWRLFRKYAAGLSLVMAGYLLLTVLRSVRGDFAPEIWKGLGVTIEPSVFAFSESLVAGVTLLLFAGLIFLRSNHRAFFAAVAMGVAGFTIGIAALAAFSAGRLGPFAFVVLVGIATYLPYMAVHTSIFERLLAVTRDEGNIGYLMYLVDSFGYLGYVAVILWEGRIDKRTVVPFFVTTSWVVMAAGLAAFLAAGIYFARHPAVRFAPTEGRV